MHEEDLTPPAFDSNHQAAHDVQTRREEHLSRLNAIGRIISSSLDIQEVYDRFAAEVRHMLPLDRTTIAILSPNRQRATLTYIWGLEIPRRAPSDSFSLDGTMGETVVRNAMGLRIQINDAAEFSRCYPALNAHWEAGVRSFLALPLVSRGEVIGLLFFNSTQPNAYSNEDLQLAESISSQIAGAIANALHFAERQHAIERLQASEERYRTLVDGSVQGILIHRNQGPLFVNQAYASLFGYDSADQILALGTAASLHPPSELIRLRHYGEQRLRGESVPAHYEVQGIRKDGQLIWLENQVRIVDWQGESALQCAYIDITARKEADALREQTQRELEHRVKERSADLELANRRLRSEITEREHAEAALRLREDHLTQLAEISRIINSSLNLQEVYEGFAHAVQRLIPFSRITISTLDESQQYATVAYVWGTEVDGRRPGDQYEIGETLYGLSIKAGSPNRVHLQDTPEFHARYPYAKLISKSGIQSLLVVPLVLHENVIGILYLSSLEARLYSEHHLRLAESISSQIAGVVANATHYAERQRAADILRESEERFRNLIEGSVQGILIHCDTTPLFVNQAWADIFGYEPDDILSMPSVLAMCAETDRERIQAHHSSHFNGDAVSPYYEYQGIRQDGTLIWLDCKETRVMWQGRPAIQSTIFDISERKHLEEQLLQTQKMEAIGTLAGGIAHDFNNILGAIIGYTQLATYDLPNDHVTQASLTEVLTASQRARELVQQILTFSSRPTTHEHQPLHLHRLVNEVRALLRASLPSTVIFETHINPEAGFVMGDPTQLHQVLMNLCANAEHAMRTTGGILEVRVDNVDIDPVLARKIPSLKVGPYVCLSIKDTGYGMSAEVSARIFEPFFTTKGAHEGTGMGLAVVHGIIMSHGGAIAVDSVPGKGTTFEIYLPQTCQRPMAIPSAPAISLKDCHREVLLVDDEEMLIQAGQQLLSRLGYTVTVCNSAPQALAMFKQTPDRFDVIVTDQTMPEMTGEGLMHAVRRIRPDIPVILCTGFSHVMSAKRAEVIGINAFLTKPINTRDLAQAIQTVCRDAASVNDAQPSSRLTD